MKRIRVFLSNIKFLTTHRLAVEFENLNFKLKDEILEDVLYEYEDARKSLKTIRIHDEIETVNLLLNNPKSFVRFGDGEINLMKGIDQPFQKYDPLLVNKMFNILNEEHRNMYIGINALYFKNVHTLMENGRFFRLYGTEFRRFFLKNCNENNTYIDASFTTAYFIYDSEHEYNYEEHYERMLSLFKDKKILIVSGEGVFEKLKYDVFSRAKRKRLIHGPSKNAFDKYDDLLKEIMSTAESDEIICFILGMAGKVMIKDLTDRGYLAWDIGHMAKDYDYYMRRVEKDRKSSDEFFSPD